MIELHPTKRSTPRGRADAMRTMDGMGVGSDRRDEACSGLGDGYGNGFGGCRSPGWGEGCGSSRGSGSGAGRDWGEGDGKGSGRGHGSGDGAGRIESFKRGCYND